jgi:hypothetical protein
MLYEKLLEVFGVDTFAGENGFLRCKSAAQSTRITSFRPLAIMSGPGRHLEVFFVLKPMLHLALGPAQIFIKGLSRGKLLAMSWRPAT